MEQEKLNKIIAENLANYRKAANFTQLEIAEKLNYSDKSVSKWEQGNGMPDIFVLQTLAELYGITVNDFLRVHTAKEKKAHLKKSERFINRWLIILMSVGICWLTAVVAYVVASLFSRDEHIWFAFLYAVPISCIILVVFSSVWKFNIMRVLSTSGLVWTVILALYISILSLSVKAAWLFFIGIPLQILIVLWYWFKYRQNKKKEKKV